MGPLLFTRRGRRAKRGSHLPFGSYKKGVNMIKKYI
jgi:hypothetical protein